MADPFEYLLGSKMKLRLIKALVLNPKTEFTASEIAKKIKFPRQKISGELKKMHTLGMIKERKQKRRKRYYLNKQFIFYPELKKMVGKCNITPGSRTLQSIKNSGKVTYAVLTGIFTENKKSVVDLLVVGDELNKGKIKRAVSNIEVDIGREIRYTTMTSEEMFYRMEMLDKFISEIMKASNIVLVDKLAKRRQSVKG
ncbi:MAG: helix-turn-helix domain-containing protein [Patescibacteria group bacterium]|nr:helix-turn-helix domain-containing protein [Patescibacteria group bacterium]